MPVLAYLESRCTKFHAVGGRAEFYVYRVPLASVAAHDSNILPTEQSKLAETENGKAR
jgi:hypothetical protein